MEEYWQVVAVVVLAVISTVILGNRSKDIAVLLTIAVCCIVGVILISYLKPIMDFISQLQRISQIQPQLLQILMKAVGIGIISEFACQICADSGNAALGKMLQMLSSTVILWLSLPLLQMLLDLVQEILGEL